MQCASSISVPIDTYPSPEIASLKKPGDVFTSGKAARLHFIVIVVGFAQEGKEYPDKYLMHFSKSINELTNLLPLNSCNV